MVYTTKNLRKDLTVRRSATFEENLEVVGGLLLPGCTVRAQVRKYASDFRVALELDVEIDGQQLMLTKPASAMKLPAGVYVYDVRLVDPEGDTSFIREGKFTVIQEVTR